MFHIKDNFSAGAPISQVPASWFNQVAGFLNGLIGGYGISLNKNPGGTSEISIDEEAISGNGTVKSVDDVLPDESGNVQLDAITEDDINVSGGVVGYEDSAITSSSSGGLTIVTNVAWDASGHKLTVTKRTLKFKNGLLVSTGTNATTTIDTATLVTWS